GQTSREARRRRHYLRPSRGAPSRHGSSTLHRHDARDEGPGRGLLQYLLPAQHGQRAKETRSAHVAAPQLADPPQERREKPPYARRYRRQPPSGILFGIVERLSLWRG